MFCVIDAVDGMTDCSLSVELLKASYSSIPRNLRKVRYLPRYLIKYQMTKPFYYNNKHTIFLIKTLHKKIKGWEVIFCWLRLNVFILEATVEQAAQHILKK